MQTDSSQIVPTGHPVNAITKRRIGIPQPRLEPSEELLKQLPAGARYIPLTQGKFAIVDSNDFDDLIRFKWHFTADGYARRNVTINGKGGYVLMHRSLLNAPDGIKVDHRLGQKIDNRRSEIRLATSVQNAWNSERHKDGSSRFKGVSFYRERNQWLARIHVNGKKVHIGYFESEELAAAAYREAALKYHKEFARW